MTLNTLKFSGIALVAAVLTTGCEYRAESQKTSCISNLKMLQAAVEQCRIAGQNPTKENVFGPNKYIKAELKCPAGGTYTLPTKNNGDPTCSIPGHALTVPGQRE